MADLSNRDKRVLENYLQMSGGHLLEFSHSTMNEFFEDFDIDITDEVYHVGSGSKANKMRGFWQYSDNATVGKVLLGLIQQYDEDREKQNSYSDQSGYSESARAKCLNIANQLVSGTYGTQQVPQQQWQAPIQQQQAPVQRAPQQKAPVQQQQAPVQRAPQQKAPVQQQQVTKQKVFIVHGHDEVLRLKVEMFIRRVGLDPIILMDQASGGSNTIIEKLEKKSDVDYAVVLYTPCDEGRKIKDTDLKARARQNVVFEHGYFIGKLGRGKVTAIVDDSIDIQNDIKGVVYIGTNEDWKDKLLLEFKEADINFDANKLYA